MDTMYGWCRTLMRLLEEDRGQDLIEYGLLISIIAAGTILAVDSIGCKVGLYFSNTNDALP